MSRKRRRELSPSQVDAIRAIAKRIAAHGEATTIALAQILNRTAAEIDEATAIGVDRGAFVYAFGAVRVTRKGERFARGHESL